MFDPHNTNMDLEQTEFLGDMLSFFSHLFTREKTRQDFLSYQGHNQFEYVPVRHEDVCIDMSRTMRRLGLCSTTLSQYNRVQGEAVDIGITVRDINSVQEAVREIIGHLNNLSVKGYLLGYFGRPFSAHAFFNMNTMSNDIAVFARPIVMSGDGVKYVKENLKYFTEQHQSFKSIDNF